MLSAQVYAVIDATQDCLNLARPESPGHARQLGALVRFGSDMQLASRELKRFLFDNLYRHPQGIHTTGHAKTIVQVLFSVYSADPGQMQSGFALRFQQAGPAQPAAQARVVADYIAGMTDRFATAEYHRLGYPAHPVPPTA